MSIHVNADTKANFQTFVNFSNEAYSPTGKGENTVARLYRAPTGDYKGTFAPLRRTLEMKTANNAVRDLFRKTIADMFGGEKFVFRFPGGETIAAEKGSSTNRNVLASADAIADKVAGLCGNVHPKQLSNVYYALSQSGISSNVKGAFSTYGISSDEHMAVTFTLSRNDETGDITIKYSEPKGMPIKFSWTTTIDVEGNVVSTPMRIAQVNVNK